MLVKDNCGNYTVSKNEKFTEEDILKLANKIAKARFRKGRIISCPADVALHLQNLYQEKDIEIFTVVYLDNQNKIIATEEASKGTLSSASVYPREIMKRTIQLGAKSVILGHNHPSGNPKESQSDIQITKKIKSALSYIDVNVLDHIIVGLDGYKSFEEYGLI